MLAWLTVLYLLVMGVYDILPSLWYSPRNWWAASKIPIDILIVIIVGRFLKNTGRLPFLKRAEPETPVHFWQQLSLGLYWLPLIVLLLIFGNDLATLGFGGSISPTSTGMSLGSQVLLLLATWLLILDCLSIAKETDTEWSEAEKKLLEQSAATAALAGR